MIQLTRQERIEYEAQDLLKSLSDDDYWSLIIERGGNLTQVSKIIREIDRTGNLKNCQQDVKTLLEQLSIYRKQIAEERLFAPRKCYECDGTLKEGMDARGNYTLTCLRCGCQELLHEKGEVAA